MIVDEFLEVKMSRTNNNYYRNKGYVFNDGDTIIIKIEDISPGSHLKIKVMCDFCNEIIEKTIKRLNNERKNSHSNGDCCKKCISKKNKKTNIDIYGVENPMHRKDVVEKIKKTMNDRYGVDSASQLDWVKEKVKKTNSTKTDEEKIAMRKKSVNTQIEKYGDIYRKTDECKERIKKTNIEKYGFDSPMKSDKVKEKREKTTLERYGSKNIFSSNVFKSYIKEYWFEKEGVDHYSKTKDFREKIKFFWENVSCEILEEKNRKTKKTCLEKYGKEFSLQLDHVRKSLRDKNGFPTSKKQQKLFSLILEKFNNAKENFVENPYIIDVLIEKDDKKLAIEYDCAYWHTPEKDEKKNKYLLRQGYCLIRIKSGRLMPPEKVLLDAIEYILSGNTNYFEIYLDDWDEKLYLMERRKQ